MRIRRLIPLLILPFLLLQGCITAKQYRAVGKLTPLAVPPEPDGTVPGSIAQGASALPVGTLCRAVSPNEKEGTHALTPAGPGSTGSGPCIAFIEYKADGHHYDPNQVDNAVALIRAAIHEDPNHQPVIVGFVHGWKHNANPGAHPCTYVPADHHGHYTECRSGSAQPGKTSTDPVEDANIQGFEHVLNFLYHCAYAAYDASSPCQQPHQLTSFRHGAMARITDRPQGQGHVVVGIYFGWYGADISPLWPVAQQISTYSRAGEADKVACVGTMSKDLTTLSLAAHPRPAADTHEPLFILAGHSYGGRLLQQAVTPPLKQRIAEQLNSPDRSVPNFADLVLYINPADPAAYGMEMFNFLGSNRVLYQTSDHTNEPLLASITTPADAATGILFTLAYSPFALTHPGNTPLTLFDPTTHTNFSEAESTAKLYRNTLPHLKEFQSHTFNDKGKQACVNNTPGSFAYAVRDHCYFVEPATPMPGQAHRWNGTPYWIISTDQHVIPDHGTIFTNRLLSLIVHFLPDDRDRAVVSRDPAPAASPASPPTGN